MPRVSELLDGVWTAEVPLGDIEARSVLVLGERRALVFDTLLHPGDMAPFSELIGDREPITLYSHADWDHVWGTAGLPERGGVVIGHAACAERFEAEVPAELARFRAKEPGVWDDVELVAPTRTFTGMLRLDIAPWTVELHHLPGHTRDSVVAWVPQLGLLLGGDAIEDPEPCLDAAAGLPAWAAGLRAWAARPELRIAVPAHGAVGDRELLARNAAWLERRSGR